jgi:two-component system LytT family response regulator
MIRTVLIDDEEKSTRALSSLLGRYCPDVEIVGEAGSAQRAVELLREEKPDLVFIDILMPDGTGFEVIEKCPAPDFNIVFVTAFEEHALRAFRFSALDYLLKPVNFIELQAAVARFHKKGMNDYSLGQSKHVEVARQVFNSPVPESMMLPSLEGFSVVKISDIVRCEADSNYTKVIFSNAKPFLASRGLAYFEELLSDLNFVRIHHKHLVNLAQVRRYHKGRGGYVEMTDGQEVEVSTRKKEEFLEAMSRFARGA